MAGRAAAGWEADERLSYSFWQRRITAARNKAARLQKVIDWLEQASCEAPR